MTDILHTKKLPLARSPQPKTLFVLSAHDIARLFLVEGYDLYEFRPIHTTDTDYNYSDKEGFSYPNSFIAGGGTVPGLNERDGMHYDHVFIKFLAQEIQKLDRANDISRIVVCLPKGLKNLFIDAFPKAFLSKIEMHLGNYVKSTFADIIKLFAGLKDEQVILGNTDMTPEERNDLRKKLLG